MLEKHPKVKEIVDKLNYHQYIPTTKWLQLSQEEAAVSLAKLLITKKSLESSNLVLRKMAKEQVDKDYLEVDSKLHVFAKEQGRASLSLTNENVTELFAHIEIGGSRYLQLNM